MMRYRTLLAALLALCLCTAGCGGHEELPDSGTESAASEAAADSETQTDSATEAPGDSDKEQAAAQTDTVYDDAGVLSAEEEARIGQELVQLGNYYRMEAAVVTTDDLGGEKPSAFAKTYFQEIFGKNANGLLILINNDTYADDIYTAGSCADYISGEEKSIAIGAATPDLVEGRYTVAVSRMLEIAEELPSHVFDDTGTLTKNQILNLEKVAASGTERWCVVLSEAVEVKAEEEDTSIVLVVQETAAAQRDVLGAQQLLYIHPGTNTCAIAGGEGSDALCEEIQEILDSDSETPESDAIAYFYNALTEST